MADTKDMDSISPVRLLSEYKRFDWHVRNVSERLKVEFEDRRAVVSHVLDEKCEAAGIMLVNGSFEFLAAKCGVHSFLTNPPTPMAYVPRINGKDLHSLMEWLLIKPKTTYQCKDRRFQGC
jgi:hypothetical protein